jgi:hypothetical protein
MLVCFITVDAKVASCGTLAKVNFGRQKEIKEMEVIFLIWVWYCAGL